MAMSINSLEATKLSLPGVLLISPKMYKDDRGFFSEIYNQEVFAEIGVMDTFVQDSISFSKKGVLRGMHYQKAPHAQAKLVRASAGAILDVVADIDPSSSTYGQHATVELSENEQNMLYIPGQYAHGFCVLSNTATVEYKLSELHRPESAGGVMYNDPVLNIKWPVDDPVLSIKDKQWPELDPIK